MPAIEHSPSYGRTLTIGRETDDKKSRPHFFEYLKELPAEQPKGAKFRTKTSASGKVHNYLLHRGWSGHLTALEVASKEYGSGKPEQVLMATLNDGQDVVKIELPFFGAYAGNLMKRLLDPKFNPTLSLSLSPYAMDKDNGGQNIGISAVSGADCTLSALAKGYGDKAASDHLVGMPELEKFTIKGEDVYDNSKMSNWLWAQLCEKVVPWLVEPDGGALSPKGFDIRATNTAPTIAPTHPESVDTNVRANHDNSGFEQPYRSPTPVEIKSARPSYDDSDLPF